MAKLKVDLTDQDHSQAVGREFETPPVGVYDVKVVACDVEDPKDKDQRIHTIVEIVNDPYAAKYPQLHDYVNLVSDASKWKLDQFLAAFGITNAKKRKVEFDTNSLKGKVARNRVGHDTYNGQVRAKLGTWFARTGGKTSAKDAQVINEEISLELHGAAADEGDTESITHLEQLAVEAGLDSDDFDTWAELAEVLENPGEAEDEELVEDEDTEAEAEDEEVDWEDLAAQADSGDIEEADLDRLYEEAATYGLDPDEFETWVEVVEQFGEQEEGEEEGEEEDDEFEVPDIANMGLRELRKACREANLPSGGKPEELRARLAEYYEVDPFSEE